MSVKCDRLFGHQLCGRPRRLQDARIMEQWLRRKQGVPVVQPADIAGADADAEAVAREIY
jgi:hypothetical protein